MRPEIDVGDETHRRIQRYARENGLRMKRAWAMVVREGLDSLDIDEQQD